MLQLFSSEADQRFIKPIQALVRIWYKILCCFLLFGIPVSCHSKKNTIRDGGSTATWTAFTAKFYLDFYIGYIVYTAFTAFTAYNA